MAWFSRLGKQYLHKGSLIYLEGRLRTRSWEDKDGNKKFNTEVVGDNLIMLDKKGENHHQQDNFDNFTPTPNDPEGNMPF